MDISLSYRQVVVPSLTAIPGSPPVLMLEDKSITMHYNWLVACKPQIIKTRFPGEPSRDERVAIEEITGNLKIVFALCVDAGYSPAYAKIFIEDFEMVLRRIYATLECDSNRLYMEIRYMDEVVTIEDFGFVDYREGSFCILKADPCPKLSPYQALLLKLDTIQSKDFSVSLIITFDPIAESGPYPDDVDNDYVNENFEECEDKVDQ